MIFLNLFHHLLILGRGWFENFKKTHKGVKLATQFEAANAENIEVTDSEWIERRRDFLNMECGQLTLPTRNHVFVAEVDKIQSPLQETVVFNVLVCLVHVHSSTLSPPLPTTMMGHGHKYIRSASYSNAFWYKLAETTTLN